MAQATSTGVALLSIQPRYASAIVEGRKRVEFRRRRLSRPISHFVVYATSPVQKIVAVCAVRNLSWSCPSRLWGQYRRVAGVNVGEFNKYVGLSERVLAIEIDRVTTLRRPIPLSSLSDAISPPQSYRYLSPYHLERILSHDCCVELGSIEID